MKINEFIEELKKIDIVLTNHQLKQFEDYANYLLEYNKTTNLTAIRDIDGVYLKHFYDSILVTKNPVINFNDIESILDVGSGAGFPGVVLKILYPHIKLTLLDSNNKKTKFLDELIKVLHLDNVTTVNDRAENFVKNHRHSFDITVARAVSELRIISELCLPLTKVNGYFIALKGKSEEEYLNAKSTIEGLDSEVSLVVQCHLPIEQSVRQIFYIKVNKIIDEKYPRPYDQIIKKPLK